jgi:NCAIR mutase (PurE)-related protein
MDINKILEKLASGEIKIEEARDKINTLMYGNIAHLKFDSERQTRTGIPEVIFCKEKTIEHVQKIFSHASNHKLNLLGTWVSKAMAEAVTTTVPELTYNPVGRTLICGTGKPINNKATVAIISGGTSDLPVVEEAADTLNFLGNKVEVFTDIGVAGIHRLFDKMDRIKKANVVIAVAGMEGALASVIAGLVDKPVIGVPTSVGYGASFDGLTPLLAMLNSCAPGVSVVNIDNGFGAACQAAQINSLLVKK